MNGVLVVIALAAVLAAVGFFLSSRSSRASLRLKESALGALEAEKDALAKEVGVARTDLKERRDELSALKEQLRDAKKRAFEQGEAQKKAGGVAAARAEVDKLSVKLAEARAEGAAAAERAKGLEAQLEKLAREQERERAAAAQVLAQAQTRAKAEVEKAAAPAPEATAPAAEAEEARFRAEKDRADKAEAKLADSKKKLGEVEKDLKAARGRLETDRRVYMVQKGELDLAHDRIAELRRRYDALRKEHEELIDAVRQAAREEQRRAESGKPAESPPAPATPAAD